jgi:hypothetical protein
MARVNTNTLEGIIAASTPTVATPTKTTTSILNKLKEAEAKASTPTTPTVEQSDETLATKAGPAPAGTFLGWDYVGQSQTTGTLRRAIVADGKGGSKVTTVTEKNPDYVSGSRGGGITGGGVAGGSITPTAATAATAATTPKAATTYTAPDGKIFTDLNTYNAYIADLKQQEKTKAGQSAYDLLFTQFQQYGMGALVEPLKDFIQQGLSSSEFTLRLRDTEAYKKRFAANAQRIAKGLRALSEAEYIGMEDQYQNVMRQYGLPESYYTRGDMGKQEGFEKFLAGDVSAVELEDRISTAQKRVLNANPEVAAALKEFYPDITNADILAYTLDPKNAIENIKRKVTAAEIGGAALQAGLRTGMTRAEELAAAGINKQQAQQGFQAVAEVTPRGSQLAEIYKQSPYTQQTAEAEVFGLAGSTEAAKQRKKLTSLETAAFGGSAGTGAIARDRAGVL